MKIVLKICVAIFVLFCCIALFERFIWANTNINISNSISATKADLDELITNKKLICNDDAWEVLETETAYKYRCGTFFPFNTNIVIKK